MSFAFADLAALLQVILIDLALAGDNAVAVGLAAAALPAKQQRQAIFWGVIGALVLRVAFALLTVQLLQIRGILLAGGLLLFWVAWRMWCDLRVHHEAAARNARPAPASFARALLTIVVADVSMSLDNVLAVAGVARHAPAIMAFGLVLSVVLMGVAAGVIARVIEKHRWIAVVGIVIIIFAAIRMVWEDLHAFFPDVVAPIPGMFGGQAA